MLHWQRQIEQIAFTQSSNWRPWLHLTIRTSGDTSVSGDVLPASEGTLASVTFEKEGSGFPRLTTTNFTAQLSSFSPLPHLILLYYLLCGIFQPSMTSFSPTSFILGYPVPASFLNTKLLQIFPSCIPPSHLGTMGGSLLRQPTKQHPLWNPVFIHSCHMPQPPQPPGCNQICQWLSHAKKCCCFFNLHTTEVLCSLLCCSDSKDSLQASIVEDFQSPNSISLGCPCFRAIQKHSKNYSFVHVSLGPQRQVTVPEDRLP